MYIRLIRSVFILGLALFAPAGAVWCIQDQADTAEIAGSVAGPNGTRLPGATVIIRRTDTGAEVRVVSGNRGMYRASGLPGGNYEIRAELKGFEAKSIPDISVADGAVREVNLDLAIATLHEIINVIGVSPQDSLEAARARESSGRDVGEALARNAGLWKLRKGGIATDVVMRGFQGEDLNVLIDGQRIFGACPNHMDPPAFHADFAEVDRIEIGKGPFDVKNQGSLGGIVNIVTNRPAEGLHAGANIALGGFGYVNPSATASYSRNGYSVLGGYSYRTSDPYTDGSGKRFTEYANFKPDLLDSSAFKANTAWTKVSAAPFANHLLQLAYTRQEADHVLYPYLQMDAVYDDTDRINFGYQIADVSGSVRSVRTQVYFSRVHHWMTDEYRVSSLNMPRSYSMGTLASTRALGGKFEADVAGVTLGLETYARDWFAATEMAGRAYKPQYSIPDVNVTTIGVYATATRQIREGLQLDFGARIDRAKSTADVTRADTDLYFAYNSTRSTSAKDVYPSGDMRLRYKNPLGFEIGAGLGHMVRLPDPRERYFGLRRMGSDWVGNPALAPSRNTGADFTGAFRRQALFLSSDLYFNHVANYIAVHGQQKVNPVPGVMNSGARSYRNVDARILGGEIQLEYLLTHRLFFSNDLSFVRGTQIEDVERGILADPLAEMPPITSRAGLRYDTGKFAAEVEGVFAGRQTRVNEELKEVETAGYGIMNLGVSTSFRNLSLRLGLNNVFDRYFIEHLSYQRDPFRSGARVPEPGRNLFFNVSFRY